MVWFIPIVAKPFAGFFPENAYWRSRVLNFFLYSQKNGWSTLVYRITIATVWHLCFIFGQKFHFGLKSGEFNFIMNFEEFVSIIFKGLNLPRFFLYRGKTVIFWLTTVNGRFSQIIDFFSFRKFNIGLNWPKLNQNNDQWLVNLSETGRIFHKPDLSGLVSKDDDWA